MRIIGVSVPRSGHHYLAEMMKATLADQLFYCEAYTPTDCCRLIPCNRGAGSAVVFQKNHDFDFSLSPDIPDVLYVVQYRDPVLAVLSDREYMAEVEGARASDLDEYVVWLGKKAAYFLRFWRKWLSEPVDRRLVLEYGELCREPASAIETIMRRLGVPAGRAHIDECVARVSKVTAAAPGAPSGRRHSKRVLEQSRFVDAAALSAFESVLHESIPGLAPFRHFPDSELTDHPTRLVFQAEMKSLEGRTEEAIDLLRRAVAVAPANAHLHVELGEALWRNGQVSLAVVQAEEACRLRPDVPEAQRQASALHATIAEGELRIAVGHAIHLLTIDPRPGPIVHLAGLMLKSREFAEAEQLAMRAIAAGPVDAGVWRECSEILMAVGNLAGALEAARGAVARRPVCAEYHHHLGSVLARLFRRDEAIAAYTRAVELSPLETLWRRSLSAETAAPHPPDAEVETSASNLAAAPRHEGPGWGEKKPGESDVIMAYRLLLGREPESAEAIAAHVAFHSTIGDMMHSLVQSAEFRNMAARFPVPGSPDTSLRDPVR